MLKVEPPKVKATIVPDGKYHATLSGVRQFENAYGQRIGFEFTLHGNGTEGARVMRSTSPHLTPKGKLADVVRGLLGRELTTRELREGVDLEKLVGRDCMVLVLQNRSRAGTRYSNVEQVIST